MVGEDSPRRNYSLEQVLSDGHLRQILHQAVDDDADCELICGEVRPAADGLTGFLGDHLRAVLHVKVRDEVKKVHLFVKRVPVENKPKAEFIDLNNYFRREALMLRWLDRMAAAEGPNPWGSKVYVCTESLIVMPDLAVAGYREHALLEPLDLRHALLAARSLARYHAAFANYETDKILNATEPYNFYEKYKNVLTEPTFKSSPWLRTAAKLTTDILDAFSTKYTKKTVAGLEEQLATSYVAACESLDVIGDTLNVMVHKDLWNNNILFKYENGSPINALLIDFQCMRYAPPSFDVMSFLYLTTSKPLREQHEREVLHYYWQIFSKSLLTETSERLSALGYGEKEFLCWCEKSRQFGVFEAAALFPQVLMEARAAQRVFDDPATFLRVVHEDRSPPVVRYARHHHHYRHRNIQVSEEYVERYLLGHP